MTAILNHPVADTSAWTAEAMLRDGTWERRIGEAERDELLAGLRAANARGATLETLSCADFPLGRALVALTGEIVEILRDGRGFIVLRGFPVEGRTDDEIRLMFLGLGQHMGTPLSQDATCALVADVKERHVVRPPGERVYGSKRDTNLHVDLTDVVGLLGVRQAPGAPLSLLASATTIYNAVLAQHPEWLPRLYEGFYWDRMNEQAAWEPAFNPTRVPLFSSAAGRLSIRYNRSWLRGGAARRGVPLTAEDETMLDFIDEVGKANMLAVRMGAGDVYFANNFTVLHGREAYEEEPDWQVAERRLFLRLWLNIPQFRPFADEAAMRFSVIGHGNLGWTAQELAAGCHLRPDSKRRYL